MTQKCKEGSKRHLETAPWTCLSLIGLWSRAGEVQVCVFWAVQHSAPSKTCPYFFFGGGRVTLLCCESPLQGLVIPGPRLTMLGGSQTLLPIPEASRRGARPKLDEHDGLQLPGREAG